MKTKNRFYLFFCQNRLVRTFILGVRVKKRIDQQYVISSMEINKNSGTFLTVVLTIVLMDLFSDYVYGGSERF
jgi:hypothetical protein